MKSALLPAALLAAAACTCALSPSVEAQVIFDTMSAANTGPYLVAPGVNFFSQQIYVAQSFTTDATAASISAVSLLLSGGSLSGVYTFSLWSSGVNAPASQIAVIGSGQESDIFGGAFSSPVLVPPPPTYFTVAFSSLSIPVTPNTRYWVYGTTTGNPVRWASHGPNLVANEMVSTENNPPTTANTMLMSVTVTPIPEPATEAAFAAGALLVLGACRWARNRSR